MAVRRRSWVSYDKASTGTPAVVIKQRAGRLRARWCYINGSDLVIDLTLL
jgi:hypothetical protein